MTEKDWRLYVLRPVTALLVGLPVYSFLDTISAWLRHGVDLPYYDDWRQYVDGMAGSINARYFFTAVNDTLAPVSLFLDALAFKAFDGNAVPHQFFSLLLVLGPLLALQWHLLKLVLRDNYTTACAFSTTLLTLQPHTYWGLQSIAYHQCLPPVFILGALAVATSKWQSWARGPLAFALTAVAGLSYISGAFVVLSVTVVLLATSWLLESDGKPLKKTAMWMLPAATATACAQMSIILINKSTHIPSAKLALPTEGPFWSFMSGLVARSLMLPKIVPAIDATDANPANHLAQWVTFGLVALVAACAATLFLSLWRRKMDTEDRLGAVIYLAMCLGTFVYLGLVCAGRANFRPPSLTSRSGIFNWSFLRFHYFWVTLLWPWLAAGIFILFRNTFLKPFPRGRQVAAAIIPLVTLPWAVAQGALGHDEGFGRDAQVRMRGFSCLLQASQIPGPIRCPELYPADLSQAYKKAFALRASFTRLLPALPLPVEVTQPEPLFQLTDTHQNPAFVPHNVQNVESTDRGYVLTSNMNPMLEFWLDNPGSLSDCGTVEVTAVVRSPKRGTTRLFYTTPEIPIFAESQHRLGTTQADNVPTEMSFIMSNPTGFHDAFRIDPVKEGCFELNEIKVRCRRYL